MIVFGVCDDDKVFSDLLSENLRRMTVRFPEEIECYIRTFHSAAEVLDYIALNPLDALLLDIDMPGMNGFELADALSKKSPSTRIVFVSGYDNFVYDSFRFNPVCFLRKSKIRDELPGVINRIVESILDDAQTGTFDTVDGPLSLPLKDILCVESVRNYYELHCGEGMVYRCRGTLTQVEKKLAGSSFYRIHAAVLVNMDNIRSVGADHRLTLLDGRVFTISQRKWSGFREAYMRHARKKVLFT